MASRTEWVPRLCAGISEVDAACCYSYGNISELLKTKSGKLQGLHLFGHARKRFAAALPGAAWRICVVTGSIICCAIAIAQIDSVARQASVNRALSFFDTTSGVPSPEAVASFASELRQEGQTCDADALYAEAEFWRTIAAGRSPDISVDVNQKELALREANIMQQISCNPTDGLAWADDAEVAARRGVGVDEIARRLVVSQRYAPYEGQALRMRLEVCAGLKEVSGDIRDVWLGDIRTTLRFGSPALAAWTLSVLPPDLVNAAEIEMIALPAARRRDIEAAIRDQEDGGT